MTRRKLPRLRLEIAQLRRRLGSIRPRELIHIAKALGRRSDSRGKEQTFICDWGMPLSIPNHPGTEKPGTARSILDALEADIDALELQLPDDEEIQ